MEIVGFQLKEVSFDLNGLLFFSYSIYYESEKIEAIE